MKCSSHLCFSFLPISFNVKATAASFCLLSTCTRREILACKRLWADNNNQLRDLRDWAVCSRPQNYLKRRTRTLVLSQAVHQGPGLQSTLWRLGLLWDHFPEPNQIAFLDLKEQTGSRVITQRSKDKRHDLESDFRMEAGGDESWCVCVCVCVCV